VSQMFPRSEAEFRDRSSGYLHLVEAGIYTIIGLVLSVTGIAVVFAATLILWRGIANRAPSDYGLQALDQLLLVLVIVEILHTVRISIRAEEILIEPFLVVGLIASVRRVLVITMQAAKLTGEGSVSQDAALLFRNSMIELGILGLLVMVFVFSLYLLRRASSRRNLVES
jgi:uncharacterized membrane protein (DUF373 family)